MKPLNPYQGAAPAAIGMMGQGIPEMGASIARTMQGGYEAMGKGLAGGINEAVSEYTKYKELSSEVKGGEKSYKTISEFLDPATKKRLDDEIESINKDTTLSLQDKAAFWKDAKSLFSGVINQGFKMQLQQQEQKAAMDRIMLELQARAEEYANRPAQASRDIMPGAPFYDDGMGQIQRLPKNSSNSTLRKKHL